MSDIVLLALGITLAAALGPRLRVPTSFTLHRPHPKPRRVDVAFEPPPPPAPRADRKTEHSELFIGNPAVACEACGLDAATVRRGVERRMHQLGACYDHALRYRPALDGTIELAFTITAVGAVEQLVATGLVDLADRDAAAERDPGGVAACVTAAIAELTFPPPDARAVHVSVPLTFRRAGL